MAPEEYWAEMIREDGRDNEYDRRPMEDDITDRRQEMAQETKVRRGFNSVSTTVFFAMIVVTGLICVWLYPNWKPMWGVIPAGIILAWFMETSIRVVDQWEKAVVLRMGKFKGLKGPGFFFIIPVMDRICDYIDQRLRVTNITAESTLTKDTVPVTVDAIVYWTVWDVEKAALEVQKYAVAVSFVAKTSLRDTIGKHELADLLQNRDKIAADLQQALDDLTNPWGITCNNVGIKDIRIPQGLSDAMSRQAQAERERQVEEELRVGRALDRRVQRRIHREVGRLALASVDDGGDEALLAQAAGGTLALLLAALCGDDVLGHLVLPVDSPPLGARGAGFG